MWAHVPVTSGEQSWELLPRKGNLGITPVQWQANNLLLDLSGQYAVTTQKDELAKPPSSVQVWSLGTNGTITNLASIGPFTERINVVRCFCRSGSLYIFISHSSTQDGVSIFQYEESAERISGVTTQPIKTASIVTEVLAHPAKKTTFLFCQTTEVATYNIDNLLLQPDITDLKPYLRLIKYYYPKEASPTTCRANIIQHNDCAYVLVWAVGIPCASILTDSWTMKKFRLEGIIELPPTDEPYKDVSLTQGGQAELPNQLWTLVSSSRLKTASVESDSAGVTAPRFFIVASTERKVVSVPLFLSQADLLNAVVYGSVTSEVTFKHLKAIGTTPSAVLYTTSNDTTINQDTGEERSAVNKADLPPSELDFEVLAFTPAQNQISSLLVPKNPILARADDKLINLMGADWYLTVPSYDAALAIQAGAAGDMSDNLVTATNCANNQDSQESLIILTPERNPTFEPGSFSPGSPLSLKIFRDDVLREVDKLKTELTISMETQLAHLEASVVQRLQAHTIIHIQDNLRTAISGVEQRLTAKHDEVLAKISQLSAAIQAAFTQKAIDTERSRTAPYSNSPGIDLTTSSAVKQTMHVEPILRKLTRDETECEDFATNFKLDCIAKAYNSSVSEDQQEHRAIQLFVSALQSTIQQQQYDKALFNAAHSDLSHNTKGFWIIMTVMEFDAKDLLRSQAKTIAMAAVRLLSESLDNWDNLPINAETTQPCVRAIWKNECVQVPLILVTRSYQTIDFRLRWIQNGLGVAQTSIELSKEEMTMMFLLLRTKVNNLKAHLEKTEQCPLPDQLRNRCVILAELVDAALEKN